MNAWVLNLEDPMDELDRRVAALMIRHRIPPEEVAGRLFLHSGRARRVTMATEGPSGRIVHPDKPGLIAAARAASIGLITIDPFVKSHGLDENANREMDAAATAWAEVAEETGAAVQLVHHVRKPPAGTTAVADIDAARGAKALTDAARVGLVMSAMSEEEAAALNVPATERWRHVRLDDAKANMAPRAERARWFRLESIALHNATGAYPHGDNVAALAPWSPPSPFAGLGPEQCNDALDRIAAGPAEGVLFAARRGGLGTARWAGRVLMDGFGVAESQAAAVIAAWLKSGLLEEAEYRDPGQRKTRLGVRVNDEKRPTAGNFT